MAEMLRALTVKQPWAGCIAHLGKDVENRSWRCPPEFIGTEIAIHAGREIDDGLIPAPPGGNWVDLFDTRAEWDAWHLGRKRKLRDVANWPPKLALGAVVALATIAGCHVRDPDDGCGNRRRTGGAICSPWAQIEQFHWVLTNVRALPEPIPCRGAQRLWRLPEDVEAQARKQLEAHSDRR